MTNLGNLIRAGQRKGFAASCRSLWTFLDMVTLISNWLRRAPLLTLFYCYVSVCQTVHGMGTRCFQVGSASCSAMTLWRQPTTAPWSWQTTQRSPTRRQTCIVVSFFWQKGARQIVLYNKTSQVLSSLRNKPATNTNKRCGWSIQFHCFGIQWFERILNWWLVGSTCCILMLHSGGRVGHCDHAPWCMETNFLSPLQLRLLETMWNKGNVTNGMYLKVNLLNFRDWPMIPPFEGTA